MSKKLDLRPSTAAIAVEMLDKQKEFLSALAENERQKTIAEVLEIIDKMPNANPSYWNKCDVVDREDLREEILALKGGDEEIKNGQYDGFQTDKLSV